MSPLVCILIDVLLKQAVIFPFGKDTLLLSLHRVLHEIYRIVCSFCMQGFELMSASNNISGSFIFVLFVTFMITILLHGLARTSKHYFILF